MADNTYKTYRKTSVKRMIMIPVIILGFCAIASNFLSMSNIKSVNSYASVIADEYLAGVEEIGELQSNTKEIHNLALSHIIASDSATMVDIVNQITEMENLVDEEIAQYGKYVDISDSNYVELQSNFAMFKDYIKCVLAFSANTNSSAAYSVANNELSSYADAMYANLDAMNETFKNNSANARLQLAKVYSSSVVTSNITIIICVAVVAIAIIFILRFVVKPIVRASKEINEIIADIDREEGDLTKSITITSNDEIAALSKGINTFINKLRDIFYTLTDNSEKLDSVVTEVLSSVRTSNDSASDLSAVTEELSATMQEVSNSANAINDNIGSVRGNVDDIATRSTEISDFSKNMKQHADNMENAARNNMEEISRKVGEILEVLENAIENSKSVDQVNALTNDILSISSQTNLLALNASIEAARAGEAGKGFAVVATEISNLADNSRESANHIQDINKIVTQAVHNLADNARNLVTFMQESILPEFEKFVTEGEEYKENATHVESVMDEFDTKTEELKLAMEEIVESIGAITEAIVEGVKGVTGAAESTQDLVNDMDNITSRMDENLRIAEDLQNETSIFKKL